MRIHALLAGLAATVSLAAVSSACTAAAAPSLPQGAPSAPTAAPASTATPDFDGDGKADLAAGIFLDPDTDAWGIRIWYGSGSIATIRPADLGSEGWDIYGPILARDLDADGYTDLVFPTGRNARGSRVTIARGSASGIDLTTAREILLSADTSTAPVALALVEAPKARLAVGLSGGNGRVVLVDLDHAGSPVGSPVTLKAGAGRIPKISGSHAGFGDALASAGNRLFVGVPYASAGGKARAGLIVSLTLSTSGVSSAKVVSQRSPGVTGAAGTYDYFGTSLAARDGYLVVGAPGDDVGSVRSTGSVQVFSLAGGQLKPVRRLSQATSGVPGKAERYDRFGRAVALGSTCAGVTTVLVGGPGERIVADHTLDGSAWLIPVSPTTRCPAVQLYEGHGLEGAPSDMVGIGEMVSVVRDGGNSVDRVVIAGGGSYSEGPLGRLIRWTPGAGETFRFDNLISGIAGR